MLNNVTNTLNLASLIAALLFSVVVVEMTSPFNFSSWDNLEKLRTSGLSLNNNGSIECIARVA